MMQLALDLNCEFIGAQRVKGKAEPVEIYRLRAVHTENQYHTAELSPLIGRKHEISSLHSCMEKLYRGYGGIVGIIGEAGVGKSRLLIELSRDSNRRLLWLQGRAFSFGQSLSYGPFIEVLRSASGITDHDDMEDCWRKLESMLVDLLGNEAPEVLPFAGMLLGLELPVVAAGLIKRLNASDVRGHMYAAARDILTAVAKRHPLSRRIR